MRSLVTLALILGLALPTVALDLGSIRAPKPSATYPQNVPAPQRNGGDTIADAVVVSVPFADTGSTVGFNDDYDEACPYTLSTSPDVVYTLIPTADDAVTIDMFGSTYDTKIYVYDAGLTLVACNDDFYPDYVSRLEDVPLMAGVQYYIVVDGYGGAAGDFVIDVSHYEGCALLCPAGAALEGEPPLVDGYVDTHNGGCASESGGVMQPIDANVFCGVSGWYLTNDGAQARDTDWFTMIVPASGVIEIVGDAEKATYLFELGPQDCNSVGVIQNVQVGPCTEGTMEIAGAPGSTVWFWVGPTVFDGSGEYDYVLLTNLGVVATESHSWTDVKSIFR
ncbi:MAG: hypothetical protein R3D98_15115 [Candidatus Krumholzibacteriia bacterium]